MKILKALLSTCVLLVYSFSQALAAPPGPPGAHLDVTQVFVDDPDNPTSIMIIGTDLDFGSGPLSVTLGEFGALAVTGTPSDTLIEADLPAGIFPGDFLLTVSNGNGQSQNDEYDLTIGAVGPQGDQGVQGKLGDTGAQGVQGKLGDTGAQGVQGKLGNTGAQGVQGKLGDTGAQGVQGKLGQQGDIGEQGMQGKIGPQGPVGGTGDNLVFQPGAVNNMQPFLAINYIIALQGVFPSRSSPDPFIAEIFLFAGNFAPWGFAFCDGQLLSISANTALFSILGTTYGGDGETTFALPDLRGRAPIHVGQGPGLSRRVIGQRGGTERETDPAHNHGHVAPPPP